MLDDFTHEGLGIVVEFSLPAERKIRNVVRIIELRGKPGKCIERHNRTVRHQWLDQYIIETIEEAQDFSTRWQRTCNNDRLNMGIGGITPAIKLKMAACVLRLQPVRNGGIKLKAVLRPRAYGSCGPPAVGVGRISKGACHESRRRHIPRLELRP